MFRASLLCLVGLALSACEPKSIDIGTDSGAVGDDTAVGHDGDSGDIVDDSGDSGDSADSEPDYSMYDDAKLVITSPSSGEVLPLGEDARFTAEITAADGSELDFDEITWTSDLDEDWAPVGADFTDDSLSAGSHTITAEAKLPNGDRLSATIGAVRVQHADAGTYYGTVVVDVTADYDGTAYTVSCIGSTLLVVDVYGETATGDSTCLISLFGYDTEAAQFIDLTLDDGDVGGEVDLDLSFISYAFEASGTLADGDLEATWADDVYGYADVAGTLSAIRVSTDTTIGE